VREKIADVQLRELAQVRRAPLRKQSQLQAVSEYLTRLAAGCWRIRRLHLAARLEQESRWRPLADDIAARLGLRRRFSVVDSVRVATPFGGFKQSGLGRELGPDALEHYTELKNVYYATE